MYIYIYIYTYIHIYVLYYQQLSEHMVYYSSNTVIVISMIIIISYMCVYISLSIYIYIYIYVWCCLFVCIACCSFSTPRGKKPLRGWMSLQVHCRAPWAGASTRVTSAKGRFRVTEQVALYYVIRIVYVIVQYSIVYYGNYC